MKDVIVTVVVAAVLGLAFMYLLLSLVFAAGVTGSRQRPHRQ